MKHTDLAHWATEDQAIRAARNFRGPQIRHVKVLKNLSLSINWEDNTTTHVTHGMVDAIMQNKYVIQENKK